MSLLILQQRRIEDRGEFPLERGMVFQRADSNEFFMLVTHTAGTWALISLASGNVYHNPDSVVTELNISGWKTLTNGDKFYYIGEAEDVLSITIPAFDE